MSRLLVLTALALEARTLARDLGLQAVTGSAWPHYRGGVLEVACVGLRAAELSGRAAALRPATLVVSAGVCGALSPALAEGQLVVPETVLTATGERLVTATVPGLARAGSLVSPADVVASPSDKARLWIETGAMAVDLESGPILEWARDRGLDAAVVRAVSDTASQSVPAELAAAVAADGTVSPSRAARAALAGPAVLARALTLRRGTTAALASVARALASMTRSLSARGGEHAHPRGGERAHPGGGERAHPGTV